MPDCGDEFFVVLFRFFGINHYICDRHRLRLLPDLIHIRGVMSSSCCEKPRKLKSREQAVGLMVSTHTRGAVIPTSFLKVFPSTFT